MGILKRIFTSMWEAFSAIGGHGAETKDYIVGLVSWVVIGAVYAITLLLLTKKRDKWKAWVRNLIAIGVTIALIIIFCIICLIIDH